MILNRLTVGDTLDFVDQVPEYPATDGWTLKYRLTPSFTDPAQAPVDLTATTYNTSDYQIQATPTTTAAWIAGAYAWTRWVEKIGQRQSLGGGRIDLLANPALLVAGYDARTQAEKALEDAKTALATFQATNGRVKSYSIAGRSQEFEAATDLVTLVKFWENECSKEAAARAKADGRPNPRRYYTRMSNG